MKITCALLPPHGAPAATTVTFPVSQDAAVSDLTHAILATDEALTQADDATLTVYLTPTSSHVHQKVAWLQRSKLTLVDAALVETHGIRLDDPTLLLQSHPLLCSGFKCCNRDIHIVAVLTRDGPPHKRARKKGRRCSVTQPLILLDYYCVPLHTIDAFRDVQAALLLRDPKPIVVLRGPPVSGKTTIANGIRRWLEQEHDLVFAHVYEPSLTSDTAMWRFLGERVDPASACVDKDSFVRVCGELSTLWFLIVDNLHLILAKPGLQSQFLDAIRELKELPNFGGFLGVGTNNTAMQSLLRDSDGLVDEEAFIQAKPFSTQQMTDLFQEMRSDYSFTDSFQRGLMAYSGGSPGVFSSLLTFTVSNAWNGIEFDAWTKWFETRGFAAYVEGSTCTSISEKNGFGSPTWTGSVWWRLSRPAKWPAVKRNHGSAFHPTELTDQQPKRD